MYKRKSNIVVSISAIMAVILACCLWSVAQKNEHYNSPLYSPRYYDPAESAPNGMPDALQKVGIDQKLGDQLPLDAEVKDESGKVVKLGEFFKSGRPVIVAFVYYECPMLCNEVLNGLTGSLKGISLNAGKILTLSRSALTLARTISPISQRIKRRATWSVTAVPERITGGTFLRQSRTRSTR